MVSQTVLVSVVFIGKILIQRIQKVSAGNDAKAVIRILQIRGSLVVGLIVRNLPSDIQEISCQNHDDLQQRKEKVG